MRQITGWIFIIVSWIWVCCIALTDPTLAQVIMNMSFLIAGAIMVSGGKR